MTNGRELRVSSEIGFRPELVDPAAFIAPGAVVVGERRNFTADLDWLRGAGVEVLDLDDPACIQMMGDFIAARPDLWLEDIGE